MAKYVVELTREDLITLTGAMNARRIMEKCHLESKQPEYVDMDFWREQNERTENAALALEHYEVIV